jgi:hypothetical protein
MFAIHAELLARCRTRQACAEQFHTDCEPFTARGDRGTLKWSTHCERLSRVEGPRRGSAGSCPRTRQTPRRDREVAAG